MTSTKNEVALQIAALVERGAYAEAADTGRPLLGDSETDIDTLRSLGRIFAQTGDVLAELQAMRALAERSELSAAKWRRLALLQLNAGEPAEAVESLARLVGNGLGDIDDVVDWLAKRAGGEVVLGMRRRLCGSPHDSIRNRIALAKASVAEGDEDGARGHLLAAVDLPINGPAAAILASRLLSAGLAAETILFLRQWRVADPEGVAAQREVELHALHAAGSPGDAIAAALEAVAAERPTAGALYWAARIFWKWDEVPRALAAVRRAAEADPHHLAIATLRGRAEAAAGDPAAALPWLRTAMRQRPNADVVSSLVDALLNTGAFDEAIETARSWVDQAPTGAGGGHDRRAVLARALRYAHRLDDALELMTDMAADGRDIVVSVALADLLELLERWSEALEVLDRTAEAVPSHLPHVAKKICYACLGMGRLDRAYAVLAHRAERLELNDIAPHADWRDRGIVGRSGVYINRGGIGDELRFLTGLSDLATVSGRLKVTCDPRMVSLLSRTFPDVELIPFNRMARTRWDIGKQLGRMVNDATLAAVSKADFALLGWEIFAAVRPTMESYLQQKQVIATDPALREKWHRRLRALGDRPKIAITWRSGNQSFRRNEVYTSLDDWAPVFAFGDRAAFINFQYDIKESERAFLRERLGEGFVEIDGFDLKNDLDQIFALLTECDLVIGPNTALLHFAGAVGTPTLMLIPRPWSYFRWRLGDPVTGADCIYPSMRQIRADAPFDRASMMRKAAWEIASRFGLEGPTR